MESSCSGAAAFASIVNSWPTQRSTISLLLIEMIALARSGLHMYTCVYTGDTHLHMYIYIYIHMCREGEREHAIIVTRCVARRFCFAKRQSLPRKSTSSIFVSQTVCPQASALMIKSAIYPSACEQFTWQWRCLIRCFANIL